MSRSDLHSEIFLDNAIAIAVHVDDTPVVGNIIDTQFFCGLEFATQVGTIATGGATFAVSIDHGDDAALSDAAAVPADFLIGTLAGAGFTGTDGDAMRRIGYVGHKRYVRYTITPASNAGDAFFGVSAIKYDKIDEATAENV